MPQVGRPGAPQVETRRCNAVLWAVPPGSNRVSTSSDRALQRPAGHQVCATSGTRAGRPGARATARRRPPGRRGGRGPGPTSWRSEGASAAVRRRVDRLGRRHAYLARTAGRCKKGTELVKHEPGLQSEASASAPGVDQAPPDGPGAGGSRTPAPGGRVADRAGVTPARRASASSKIGAVVRPSLRRRTSGPGAELACSRPRRPAASGERDRTRLVGVERNGARRGVDPPRVRRRRVSSIGPVTGRRTPPGRRRALRAPRARPGTSSLGELPGDRQRGRRGRSARSRSDLDGRRCPGGASPPPAGRRDW